MQRAAKSLLVATLDSLREITVGSVSDTLPITFFVERLTRSDYYHRILHADFLSVYWITGGRGTHVIGDQRYEIGPGDVYTMRQGMSHYFEKCSRLQLAAVHFQPSVFCKDTWSRLSRMPGLSRILMGEEAIEDERWLRLSPSAFAEVGAMLRTFADEWHFDGPDQCLMAQAHFLNILVYLARCRRSMGALPPSTPVSQVKVQIEGRYGDALRISDLAASCFLSQRRLSEIFRAEVGSSPRDYLGQVRIEAAKRLLRNTDMVVAEIASQVGYTDPAYFARIFRRQMGLTPSEFRRERTSLASLLSKGE